jgi:hypothetical protein
LAGDLAKVQPLLQRLHLVEPPKKRADGRRLILVSSVIAALALVLAAVAVRRRCRPAEDAVALEDELQGESLTEDALSQPPADF